MTKNLNIILNDCEQDKYLICMLLESGDCWKPIAKV